MITYDRSSWRKIIFRYHGSILFRCWPEVLIAIGISLIARAIFLDNTDGWGNTMMAHNIIATPVAILVVFRTNTCGGRYEQSRNSLGGILRAGRDLVRLLSLARPKVDTNKETEEKLSALVQDIGRQVALFFHLAVFQLQGERDFSSILEYIKPEEEEELKHIKQRPSHVLNWVTHQLVENRALLGLDEALEMVVMDCIYELDTHYAGAMKVKSTPLAFPYAQHVKLLLVLWCFSAPFAMYPLAGGFTMIGVSVLALVFFGIERIGMEIEDPFGNDLNDLPVHAICKTHENDVLQLLRTQESAPLKTKELPDGVAPNPIETPKWLHALGISRRSDVATAMKNRRR